MDANKNIPSSYLYLPFSGHAFEVCHVNCCSRLINPNRIRITYPLQLLEMTPEKTSERVYPGCAESFTKRCIQVDPTSSPIFLRVQPIGHDLSDLSLRWSNLIEVTTGKRRPFFCLSIFFKLLLWLKGSLATVSQNWFQQQENLRCGQSKLMISSRCSP